MNKLKLTLPLYLYRAFGVASAQSVLGLPARHLNVPNRCHVLQDITGFESVLHNFTRN